VNFEPSERATEFRERLLAFMDEHVYPAEPVYAEAVREAQARGEMHPHP
jgi:acyl-CoA dehydrogenase